MKRLVPVLAHAGVVLSVIFMVFRVLHWYNPVMGFLTNQYTTPLLWLFCIVSLLNALILIVRSRRE